MPDSPLSSVPPAAWRPLQETAAEVREECRGLEQLVQELFAGIERLQRDLEAKADELEGGRKRLAERGRQLAEQRKELARLSHQLEQQETQLSAALTELRELRAQLTQERDEAGRRNERERQTLQEQLLKVQAERDALTAQLQVAGEGSQGPAPQVIAAAARSEQAVAQLSQQFGQLRQEWQTSSSTLVEAMEQATQRALANLPLPAPGESAPGAQLGVDPEHLQSLQRERLELEAELDLVRARAAELQETVTRQKRELTEQREGLAEELKELRRLVEDQGQLLSEREPSGGFVEEHPDRKSAPLVVAHAPAHTAADPVVNSVMAQFAKLQKDVALRRKKR